MKKSIALVIVATSMLSMFAYALSAEKELQVQTATDKIMNYLLIQPREVANQILLMLKAYQSDFLQAGATEKASIVTLLLDQLVPFSSCIHAGGTWLVEVRECEGISQDTCTNMGGQFDDCASSCRHSGAEICTLQCVPVCNMAPATPAIEVEQSLRIQVGPTQTTCLDAFNQQTSCLLIKPAGQLTWTLMPEGIVGFARAPGFRYELDVLVTNDGVYHYLNTVSKEIDLQVCASYYDGCNVCTVTNGKIAACTRKYCAEPEAPRCQELVTE